MALTAGHGAAHNMQFALQLPHLAEESCLDWIVGVVQIHIPGFRNTALALWAIALTKVGETEGG
jgi:hypothetical protein